MEECVSDLSWLDNYFGYGGVTPSDFAGRYTSVSDFLGIAPEELPNLPFSYVLWRENLQRFSHEVVAENLKAGTVDLACGSRDKSLTSTCSTSASRSSLPSLTNSRGAHGGYLPSGVRDIPLEEIPCVDFSKSHLSSYRSCISTDEPDSESVWQGRPREDWWDHPYSVLDGQVRCLENIPPFTRLLDMEIVKDAHRPEAHSPWLEGRSDEIYERMGIRDPTRSYVAFWLGMGNYSTILFASEVVDKARLDNMLANDPLNRLKLLLQPVRVSLPFPAKSAKDADTVGAFFGRKGASIRRFRARCGAEVTSVQIDLFSKWLLKAAMTKVGLREGNSIEAVLVDWLPGCPAVLSAGRLNATQRFLRTFNAP